ncbi:MAG: PH domain-containing protein [Limisphaerales bacterium]
MERPVRPSGAGGMGWAGDMPEYSAPWSGLQKAISGLVTVILGVVTAALFREPIPSGVRLLAVAGVVVILGIGLASMVLGYAIGDREVLVRRPFRRTRLPLAGLVEVVAEPDLAWGALRLFGNGGFLSSTGIFWNRRLGRFRLLANNTSTAVLLRYADRRVVLSPADPTGFAREVRLRAGLTG